jgi:PRC-barrel domain
MSSSTTGQVKDPDDTSRRLVAASKVNGTAVYDMRGERLGSIEDIMIGKAGGQVNYAVLPASLALGANTTRCRGASWTTIRASAGSGSI